MRRALRQAMVLCGVAMLPALLAAALHPRRPAWSDPPRKGEVLVSTAVQWGEQALWVDARSRREYNQGHVPGAVLLNEDEWDRLIRPFLLEHWSPGRKMVVYCSTRSCHRADAVAARLRRELGASAADSELEVHILKGKCDPWRGVRR